MAHLSKILSAILVAGALVGCTAPPAPSGGGGPEPVAPTPERSPSGEERVIYFTGWRSYSTKDFHVQLATLDGDAVQDSHIFKAEAGDSGGSFEMSCTDAMDTFAALLRDSSGRVVDQLNSPYVGCEGRFGQWYEVRILGTDEIGVYAVDR